MNSQTPRSEHLAGQAHERYLSQSNRANLRGDCLIRTRGDIQQGTSTRKWLGRLTNMRARNFACNFDLLRARHSYAKRHFLTTRPDHCGFDPVRVVCSLVCLRRQDLSDTNRVVTTIRLTQVLWIKMVNVATCTIEEQDLGRTT